MNNIGTEILAAAYGAWNDGASRLAKRERLKRYTYGDQWGDIVADSNGRRLTEGQLVSATGRAPLTNNLIRRLVKTIVGRYRSLGKEQKRYDGDIAAVAADNCLPELDSRMLEEFLISGIAAQRVTPGVGNATATVHNVNPRDLFVGAYADPIGRDMNMVGMLHTMSMYHIMQRFGRNNEGRMQRLCRTFDADVVPSMPLHGGSEHFFATGRAGSHRVVEVWTRDAVQRRRGNRVDIQMVWRGRWLAPDGTVLAEEASPWQNGAHPFVVKMYPLTDGEVHPFVEDVIEQQRYINRLITMIDRMMGSAAKGVLLFPVDQKLPEFSWEQVRRCWSASDGVIPVSGRGPTLPQQVVSGGADAGAHRLLELQLKLFEDVSGVSDALTGAAPSGNGGSALYESRINSSTIALADLLDTFDTFTLNRDRLALAEAATAAGAAR